MIMEQTTKSQGPTFNLLRAWEAIKKHKMLYYKFVPATLMVTWLLTLCYPDYYKCKVTLVPESSTSSANLGALASLASSFGMNIGGGAAKDADAITPMLYPDLMKSLDFVTSLFDIKVKQEEDSIVMPYYLYLRDCQREPLWDEATDAFWNLVLPDDEKKPMKEVDPFKLTGEQRSVMGRIISKVVCTVDKKTDVISIDVTDQDPLVAATVADSVRNRLQASLTEYRTKKARHNLEYVKMLHKEAKVKYDRACDLYADFMDSNQDIVLESVRLKQTRLENEMQLLYNNYNALSAQLLAAMAKVQEDTPAFTTLERATVPSRIAGPQRKRIVIIFTLLVFVAITVWALFKEGELKPLFKGLN